jgi:hypothetical protein
MLTGGLWMRNRSCRRAVDEQPSGQRRHLGGGQGLDHQRWRIGTLGDWQRPPARQREAGGGRRRAGVGACSSVCGGAPSTERRPARRHDRTSHRRSAAAASQRQSWSRQASSAVTPSAVTVSGRGRASRRARAPLSTSAAVTLSQEHRRGATAEHELLGLGTWVR